MPLEPATNAIWIESVKTLQAKDESERSEFERQIFARLGELQRLVEGGNRSVDQFIAQLETAKEQTLKACGAYENTIDMLATYYMQKRHEQQKAEATRERSVYEHPGDAPAGTESDSTPAN